MSQRHFRYALQPGLPNPQTIVTLHLAVVAGHVGGQDRSPVNLDAVNGEDLLLTELNDVPGASS